MKELTPPQIGCIYYFHTCNELPYGRKEVLVEMLNNSITTAKTILQFAITAL